MFKKMDNPWLIRVLFTALPLFGMIVGAALAPLFVETIHPDWTEGSLDIYAQWHPDFYKTGALCGLVFGLVLAAGIVIQLARQAEAAAKNPPAEAHAH